MLRADRLTSLIFYGPPGTGKTSLARVIANQTRAAFCAVSAPAATVADIRQILAQARDRLAVNGIANGLVPRRDPSVQPCPAGRAPGGHGIRSDHPDRGDHGESLLCHQLAAGVPQHRLLFRASEPHHVVEILKRALADKERGLGRVLVTADPKALEFLAVACDGDARKALTALEVGVLSQAGPQGQGTIHFDLDLARQSIQHKSIHYDGTGDTHYDLASALQKSMRGSDPDATVYWLARMIAGGEDPRFIARRIAVCAAEDVGNADPLATVSGCGGRSGRGVRWVSGGPTGLGPGGDLCGLCPQVQCRRVRHLGGDGRCAVQAHQARAQAPPR